MLNPQHSDLDGADLHKFARVSESDPGAIGAGKGWYKESTNELKVRNAGNSAWVEAIAHAALTYKGTWNAATNTPALADGAGNPDSAIGDLYRVTTGGTRDLGSGSITYVVGDYVLLNHLKVWEKLDTTDAVSSVAGKTGAVVLVATDISDSTAAGRTLLTAANASAQRTALNVDFYTIPVPIGDGVNVISTGFAGIVNIDIPGTIVEVKLLAKESGNLVVDIWKDTYANYPPTVADTITASAKPTLSGANKFTDSALTGWTKTLAAGDVLQFNVDSVATITHALLSIKVQRT